MFPFGGLLLSGLCLLFCTEYTRGVYFVPLEFRNFEQCSEKPCPANASCEKNQWGNFCICDKGFCNRDYDLMLTCPSGTCHEGDCTAAPSKPLNHTCTCPAGFTGPFEKCEDIDECAQQPSLCIPPSVCINTPGYYSCACPNGYREHKEINSNVTLCEDIDECSVFRSPCSVSGICHNTPGNFFCTCPEGYDVNKDKDKAQSLCKDIDECSLPTSPCPPPAICKNVPGNFSCSCPSGYELNNEKDNNMTLCKEKTLDCESALSQEDQRLEQCKKDRKDALCALMDKNIHIIRTACQKNEMLQSLENVTNDILQFLNQSLTHLNTSDQQTIVTFLLESVETIILAAFIQEPSNTRINTSELEAVTKVAQNSCDSDSSFLTLYMKDNSMSVPCNLVPGDKDGAVFITYTNLQSTINTMIPQWLHSSVINSQIVTGSITAHEKENLDSPVSFYLKHLQTVDRSMTTLCVFWDPSSSAWSRRGCATVCSNTTHTLCSCSHLSSFAIITSFKDIQDDGNLTLLSRIGLSVSIFCLAVSFLTFLLCHRIRSAHTSVLMALIGCLFLGQLLFLLGAHQTMNKLLCSIIAGGLHFFFLSAFCWMSLESVLLFLTVRNLRAMNYLTEKRRHFPSICVVGFGVPVIIVIISAAIHPHGYGTDRHCWLGLIAIWSFLGPVLVLIVINTTLLLATLCLLQVKLASLNTNVSTLKDKRLLIFKAVAQVFILGCSWIFGYFQFGQGAQVMSYLFTGLNSLQGAFIFLVHCLLNQQVRNEYRKIFHRTHTQRSDLDTKSKNTVPMTGKSTTTTAYELSQE